MKMSQLATAADTSGREHEIIVATFAVKLSFFERLMYGGLRVYNPPSPCYFCFIAFASSLILNKLHLSRHILSHLAPSHHITP